MVETLEKAHAASGDEPAVDAVAEAVDMKERQAEQEPVGRGDLPAGEKVDRVGREVVVGEDRAFGRTCRARGIDDACRPVAVERDGGTQVFEGGRFPEQILGAPDGDAGTDFAIGNERRGLGVGEDVSDLAVSVEDVDGNEYEAQLDAGEKYIDHLDRIGQIDGEAVARAQAAAGKELGEPIAARVYVAKGPGVVAEFKCDLVAAALEREVEEVAKIHVSAHYHVPYCGFRCVPGLL